VQKLQEAFGVVPEKKRPMRLIVTFLIVGALIAIALLILIANLNSR
jgi:uncharacterized integral membrane protein